MSRSTSEQIVHRAAETLNYAMGIGMRTAELAAQDTVERMNHKDEVYTLAGEAALHGNIDIAKNIVNNEQGTTKYMLGRIVNAHTSHAEAIEERDARIEERASLTPPTHSFLDGLSSRRQQRREYALLKKKVRQEHVEGQIGKNPIKPTGIKYHVNRLSEVWDARSTYRSGQMTKSEYLDRKMHARINPDNMTNARHQKKLEKKTQRAERKLVRSNNAPLINKAKNALDSMWEARQNHKDNTAERKVKSTKRTLERRVSQPIASRVRNFRSAINQRQVNFVSDKAGYYKSEYRHLRKKRLDSTQS